MRNQVIANAIYSNDAAFAQGGVPFVPMVGPADDGPLNTPTPLTQPSQASSVFKGGPLASWAAIAIKYFGLPVLAVRAAATAASSFGTPGRTSNHGTSAVTVDAGSGTDLNVTVCVAIITGCTIGVSGGQYAVSTDGGQTYGTTTALSTATSIAITLGTKTLTLDFGSGTLVASEIITVVCSFIAQGSEGTLNTTLYPGTGGTGSASLDNTYYPDNDYDVIIKFNTGGALGTAGITYQYSTSKGGLGGTPTTSPSDWSPIMNLGTALYIVVPGTGTGTGTSGAKVILGTSAETIITGAQLSFRCYAPSYNQNSVSLALTALFQNKTNWGRRVIMCGQFQSGDAGMAQAIDAIFASYYKTGINQEKSWIGSFRMQNDGESSAAHATAGQTFQGLVGQMFFGSIGFGDCKIISAITGFLHKRPFALLAALDMATVSEEIDTARTDRPGLPCILADVNGNPDCYDASLDNGAMDDYGFITATTQPEGIYVNNPRMFVLWQQVATSMTFVMMRDLLNKHTNIARAYFRKQLAIGIDKDTKTGYILESEARRLEQTVNDLINDVMGKQVSGQRVTVSRTDNLNNLPVTMNVSGKLVTLAYLQTIEWTDQIVSSL